MVAAKGAAKAPVLGAVGVARAGARKAGLPTAGASSGVAVSGALRAWLPSAGTKEEEEEEALVEASTAEVSAAFATCDGGAM